MGGNVQNKTDETLISQFLRVPTGQTLPEVRGYPDQKTFDDTPW